MSDKKHIDRVFQEKFKDFEVPPNERVWENIKKELDQPKRNKPRIVPFWLKLTGAAAVLLLLVTFSTRVLNTNTPKTNNTPVVKTNSSPALKKDSFYTNTPITNKTPQGASAHESENDLRLQNTTPQSTAAAHKTTFEHTTDTQNPSNVKQNNNTATNTSNQYKLATSNKNTLKETQKSPKKAQVSSFSSNDILLAEKANPTPKTQKQSTALSQSSFLKAYSNSMAKILPVIDTAAIVKTRLKSTLSIEDAIAMAKAAKQGHEKEKPTDRWQVSANIAPVYYNTFGDGSHIDDQFVGSSKTGEVNTSYGVHVSYTITKKLQLRTGVSNVTLSYDTNDVVLYENVASLGNNNSTTLKNITLSNGNQSLTALSANHLSVQQIDSNLLPNANAAISQRINYYEIPIELGYKLLDRRTGIQIIGGFSSFFLNNNDVYSEIEDNKTYIGKANNINNLSFSGNLGIGIDYKFTKAFKFNIEPSFKYQFNAYENTSGTFNPYIIGVYTGFSYNF
ncbi:hypothetical protein IA57_05020 [Mangrovimonas yunxiaonensis]|uniref:Outer membrane protein beta-barrel domain-containing protein n=1 Tax=Mangrovimonas yunxiaonensis TaxID=1197477 RepID=A0A084TKF9_9FLAO|nr:hypothetical protein [Mangrovimonas yunxiaonensis]KFB01195.1 hypothetical protein IA57_05020 [Mangrovimonas yunxiaonensis]GGH38119.1 hypothetical protein GCM10011364_06640 [Mangrovimonas yunxiaonensis]